VYTEAGSSAAADHEARNEYLSGIHETWEEFRVTVEEVQSAYEESLESGSKLLATKQADAAAAHAEAIDEAWSTYKQEINETGSKNRRDGVASARAKYHETSERVRNEYNEAIAAARDAYSTELQDARTVYEAAVEGALATYRNAVQNVQHFLEPSDDDSLDDLGLAGAIAARESENQTTATNGTDLDSMAEGDILIEHAMSSLNGRSS
jgi:hypothetical protein